MNLKAAERPQGLGAAVELQRSEDADPGESSKQPGVLLIKNKPQKIQ